MKSDNSTASDNGFVAMAKAMYPTEYACSEKIAQYIKAQCDTDISEEDKAYLTIHIRRIILPKSAE